MRRKITGITCRFGRRWARRPCEYPAQITQFGTAPSGRRVGQAADQNGGSVRGYQAIFVPLAALSSPSYGPMDGQPTVYFSLSHKCFDISYCEINRLVKSRITALHRHELRRLAFFRLEERSISPCETASGLCDRLDYALHALRQRPLMAPLCVKTPLRPGF